MGKSEYVPPSPKRMRIEFIHPVKLQENKAAFPAMAFSGWVQWSGKRTDVTLIPDDGTPIHVPLHNVASWRDLTDE